jgi:hypothetical protein
MKTETIICNLAYALCNSIDTKDYEKLKFSLNTLKRAIKEYEERSSK